MNVEEIERIVDQRLAAKRIQCLNSREAAKLLGVSERTLASLVADGAIPSFTIGRARRFELLDLEDWIASRTEGGQS